MLLSEVNKVASQIAEISAKIWYHGSPNRFDEFDPQRAADGHAKEGPGFYLTSDEADARRYGENVMRFKITPRKLVPLQGRVSTKEVTKIMRAAPNLEDSLMNWDENPIVAFRNALAQILKIGSPKEIFEAVWFDFYKNDHLDWLNEMVAMGYTGILIPRNDGVQHFICFDGKALTRL